MKLENLLWRAWNYFKIGYSSYLTFFVSFFTFVSTTYYLAIRSIPFLEEVFPNFWIFITMGIFVLVPFGVLIGWLHMKGTLAQPMQVVITQEANPYNYKLLPGKETELYAPFWLLIIKSLRKILENESMLSPQEKDEFEGFISKCERLLDGKIIGKPRQRRLFAELEREKDDS